MQEATTVQNFLQSMKPLLLILGKRNSGRTHLLSEAASLIPTDHLILRVKGITSYSPGSLVELFKKHWAVKLRDTSAPLNEQLTKVLHSLTERQQHCLLLIDQAHLLPISVLAALCHLSYQQESQPISIRIILAGHPELGSKINALYLKKFAYPPVISLTEEQSPTNTTPPNKSNSNWWRHSTKAVAFASLFICGFSWWKLQQTNITHTPFAKTITHYLVRHHA